MALRAFHANPNIGGFGNENTAPLLLGDPTKNLPATNASTKNPNPPPDAGTVNHSADESGDALCQIVKELVDNAVDACETARRKHQSGGDSKVYRVKVEILPYHTNDADDGKTPLQVTVSDNGSGMNEIQACVNAFQSSKGGDQDDANTAGRYGIGLTLCLLHAQRLVPGTYSCITSATREAQSFKRALFFVDTAGDTVECHREEEVAKGGIEESGTCVSLLVPGGRAARAAWKRLESYLKRFQLSSIQCSIEALAPTLSSVPLHILHPARLSSRHTVAPSLDIKSKELAEALDTEDDDDDDDSGGVHEPRKKNKESFSTERKKVQVMAQKYGYFQRPLKLQNIAHSEHPIRIMTGGTTPTQPSGTLPPDPKLIVDILVSPHEETHASDHGSSQVNSAAACLELVRMVNSVPLLDGAESFVCGLVKALQSSVVWSSFGLAFLGTSDSGQHESSASWTNSFSIRDSDQVAPFFQSHNHQLWEEEQEPTSIEPDDDDVEGSGRKKRGRNTGRTNMMPAKVRLGKILILVDIIATPSTLPLPTLSKGRLPINHLPITQAFHLGLRDCLRSLQQTSPGLLLTAMQLRTVERDVRYIPLMASAAAGILSRMQDQTKRQQLLRKIKEMHDDEDGTNLNALQDPESALRGDEIVRTIERRTAAAISAMESSRKQKRRRAKSTKKVEPGNHEYSDLENSEAEGGGHSAEGGGHSISSVSHEESSQPPVGMHTITPESHSIGDDSSHSISSSSERPTHNEKLETQPVGGVPVECDDDDDEWW